MSAENEAFYLCLVLKWKIYIVEKRNNESKEALLFAQELTECGSNVEVLSFLNILLKRFEYCQQFKMPAEPKVRNFFYTHIYIYNFVSKGLRFLTHYFLVAPFGVE